MAKIAPQGKFKATDSTGAPLSGGRLYTLEAGTTTNKATYTTSAGDVANTNPVVLNSRGEADVWLASGEYKFVLKDSSDVPVWTVDNIIGEGVTGYASSIVSTATAMSITTAHKNNLIICTASLTLNLLSASTLKEGFVFIVKNTSTSTVTIDPIGSETIDGGSTLSLGAGVTITVVCDGVNWISFSETVYNGSSGEILTGNGVGNKPTFKNPEFSDGLFRILGSSDSTKKLEINVDGVATGTTRTITVPDEDVDLTIATQAEAEAGIDSTKKMSPLRVKQAINALETVPVFTKSFTSAEQTIAVAGGATIAHGLGATPTLLQCVLVCKTATGGFAVGDEVIVSSNVETSYGTGVSTSCNNTHVSYRIGNNGTNPIGVIHNSTGVSYYIQSAEQPKWRLKIRAWL